MKLSNFKLIIFDLDGTLTKSKSNLGAKMSRLFLRLLQKKIVAVTSGGNFSQFKNQLLKKLDSRWSLPRSEIALLRDGNDTARNVLENLYLLPTSGTSLYYFQCSAKEKWQPIYRLLLSQKEKQKIMRAFEKSFIDIKYIMPKKIFGKIIEDRESQITFSALGQKAPLKEKTKWNDDDKQLKIRKKLRARLEKYLPEFKITIGGLTSIDVTKKGIDKAYGINQLQKILAIPKKEIIFIGDALFRGGNDYEVRKAKVKTLQVKDEKETMKIIEQILTGFPPRAGMTI